MIFQILWLDQLLLDRFERLAHQVQLIFGVDNFSLARFGFGIFVFVPLILGHKWGSLVGAFIYFCFVVYSGFDRMNGMKAEMEQGFKNPESMPHPILAAGRLLMVMLGIFFELPESLDVPKLFLGYAFFLYLGACTPLPPRRSKVRDLLRFLRRPFVRHPLPSPG